MSYYSKKYKSSSDIWAIIICFALIFAIMFGFNCCSYSGWNDGICPECETRYELRGVSKYMRFYVCPECGKEVQRY